MRFECTLRLQLASLWASFAPDHRTTSAALEQIRASFLAQHTNFDVLLSFSLSSPNVCISRAAIRARPGVRRAPSSTMRVIMTRALQKVRLPMYKRSVFFVLRTGPMLRQWKQKARDRTGEQGAFAISPCVHCRSNHTPSPQPTFSTADPSCSYPFVIFIFPCILPAPSSSLCITYPPRRLVHGRQFRHRSIAGRTNLIDVGRERNARRAEHNC